MSSYDMKKVLQYRYTVFLQQLPKLDVTSSENTPRDPDNC